MSYSNISKPFSFHVNTLRWYFSHSGMHTLCRFICYVTSNRFWFLYFCSFNKNFLFNNISQRFGKLFEYFVRFIVLFILRKSCRKVLQNFVHTLILSTAIVPSGNRRHKPGDYFCVMNALNRTYWIIVYLVRIFF